MRDSTMNESNLSNPSNNPAESESLRERINSFRGRALDKADALRDCSEFLIENMECHAGTEKNEWVAMAIRLEHAADAIESANL